MVRHKSGRSDDGRKGNFRKGNATAGPVGLDIGTANIVVAHNGEGKIVTRMQTNAFYAVPYSKMTEESFSKEGIMFFDKENMHYVMGNSAQDFANMFGGDTRRPIADGLLNPQEGEAMDVLKELIAGVVDQAMGKGQKICFSVPGRPLGGKDSVVYHESVLKRHLQSLGYTAMSVNEGLAVVLSELSDNNYTGIGISIGGGMCNVCFSYLAVPVVAFSIQRGGDYIDAMVGESVGEKATRIKVIKERKFDLSVEPVDRVETALHIYYDDLFSLLAKSIHQVLGSSDGIPRLSKPVPVVLSGGSVLPKGSREKFAKALKGIRLPLKISEIRVARDPLLATARGAFISASMAEDRV